jgi:catechol 2,3-dioxygenase-like lactoylglutathione lyase family enzyme
MDASPGITNVAQAAITVRDLDASIAFYRDKLGLEFLFAAPPGLAFLACGSTRLMLSAVPGERSASHPALYYGVPDIHGSVAALERRGLEFEESPRVIAKLGDREVWLAVTRDPDGHLVGIMSEVRAA